MLVIIPDVAWRRLQTRKGNGNSILSSWSDRGPDAAVVGRNSERRFLQGDDSVKIEGAAVKLFDVVAADRKPERYCLIGITNVDRNKCVGRSVVTGEQQYAFGKIAVPVAEESSTRRGEAGDDFS